METSGFVSANLFTVSHFWDEGSGEQSVTRGLVQPQMRDACPRSAFPALEKVEGQLGFSCDIVQLTTIKPDVAWSIEWRAFGFVILTPCYMQINNDEAIGKWDPPWGSQTLRVGVPRRVEHVRHGGSDDLHPRLHPSCLRHQA
jgi:hypothetical protein